MGRHRPPIHPNRSPQTTALPAGTILYRLHNKAYPATSFNPIPSHKYFDGGRFDATSDDQYPYIYAGDSPECAVAETLLRDVPISNTGAVTITLTQVQCRRLSEVATTIDLELVDLTDLPALRSASQDTWLTTADPCDYAQTRHWAHWLRGESTTAAGFVWRSKRDPARLSYVLFEDRCAPGVLATGSPFRPGGIDPDFDHPDGLRYLATLLDPLNADIATFP